MLSLFSARNPYNRFQDRPFLVVDWMTTGVVLSEVSVANGSPTIVRSQFELWPAGLNGPATPAEIGAWLKTLCTSANYPTTAVAISVPRRDLSLKLLELPNVSDDELGPLVALQVELRVQSTGQAVAWDFLPHAAKREDSHRYVMLATMPIQISDAIRRAAEVAGWANLMLTSGDLLASNLAPASDGPWQVQVQANRVKLELLMCYRGLPVSSYATGMPTDNAAKSTVVAAAIAIIESMSGRLLAGSPKAWQSDTGSSAIFVTGSFASQIAAGLAHEMTSVQSTLVDDRSPRVVAVATSLLSENASRIDFLRPRSADGRTASRKRRVVRIVAMSTAALFLVGTGLWMWHRSLQSELAQLDSQRQLLQQYIDRGQDTVNKWSYVSRWQNGTVQAAREIRGFATLLPSRERMIVTRLQLENVVDSENSTLRIDGLAQSAEDVLQMNASILEQASVYDLRPQGIEPAPSGSIFPSQFRIEAVLRADANSRSRVTEKESK